MDKLDIDGLGYGRFHGYFCGDGSGVHGNYGYGYDGERYGCGYGDSLPNGDGYGYDLNCLGQDLVVGDGSGKGHHGPSDK